MATRRIRADLADLADAFNNRATVRYDKGDLERAQQDYERPSVSIPSSKNDRQAAVASISGHTHGTLT